MQAVVGGGEHVGGLRRLRRRVGVDGRRPRVVRGLRAANVELAADESILTRLATVIENNTLPPAYFAHPVVNGSPDEQIVPVALYMDGVRFTKSIMPGHMWSQLLGFETGWQTRTSVDIQ